MTTPNKPARACKHWKPGELQFLADHFGLICDKSLAVRLQRKESAVIAVASHKRVVSRKMNFYTARALAKLLGIPSYSSVLLWVKKGWLRGRQAARSQGKWQLWRFSEHGVVECLKKRPWLADPNRMEEHYFRFVVIKEWERDPWYTVEQAAALLGFTHPGAVYRYINRGWLAAEKRTCLGAKEGEWIIRRSAIQAFLQNDPRPEHKYVATSTARRRFILLSGNASRLATLWLIKCPCCGEQVRISAPPQLRGPQVRERFIAVYVNGRCEHGAECVISPRR